MSLNNERGAYTEEELAAGILSILKGGLDYKENEEDHSARYLEECDYSDEVSSSPPPNPDDRVSEAIRILAGLTDKDKMTTVILHRILESELDAIKWAYAKHEMLPATYVKLADERNCISILLRGVLHRVAKISLNTQLVQEIEAIEKSVRVNYRREIVYERVGHIQSFIHQKVNDAYGFPTHADLPKKTMRNLLSTCRLYLSIFEFRKRDAKYLLEIFRKSDLAVVREIREPSQELKFPVKRFISDWRVDHIKALHQYSSYRSKLMIKRIIAVSDELPIDYFRMCLIAIYSESQDLQMYVEDF